MSKTNIRMLKMYRFFFSFCVILITLKEVTGKVEKHVK